MPDYTLTFVKSARKELESLDTPVVRRVFPKIESLSRNPRPPGSKKLHGSKHLWRIRIGDYRVIYAVDDNKKTVDVTAVRHRSRAYER